jgi:hypothetical protein
MQPGKKIWLIFHGNEKNEVLQSGYHIGQEFVVKDFEVTRLDIKFLNPKTRTKQLKKIILAEITRN